MRRYDRGAPTYTEQIFADMKGETHSNITIINWVSCYTYTNR